MRRVKTDVLLFEANMSKTKLVLMVPISSSPHIRVRSAAYGKGLDNLDASGTFGLQIPMTKDLANERDHVQENTLQSRLVEKRWPEVEFNTPPDPGGDYARKALKDTTPSIVAGRSMLTKRISMSIGGSSQIATNSFNRNNHNGMFTVRFPF